MTAHTYTYVERLNGESVTVTLPETREAAFAIYREIQALAETDPQAWKAAMRLWTAADLYICGLFHSFWHRPDPWTGRAEVDSDFQFEHARWVQFEADDAINYAARQHGKTTWTEVRCTQEIVRDPNITIAIFSFDLQKGSRKHLVRWKREIEANAVLRAAWDDVFFADPRQENANWSVEHGCTVKRTIESTTPTISAYTFMAGLPTGARFSVLLFDDCETEETVESDDQRAKAKDRFRSAINLGGRSTRVWVLGTFHHPAGLLADLIKNGWRAHTFPAEDINVEPPDIAALYDAVDGRRPDTGAAMPEAVRTTKLRGMPVYLHPLECAILRHQEGHDKYETQYMGDPLAGKVLRFRREWVADELRIKADLREWAQGKYAYVLSDPSKGMNDPSVGLVVVTDSDKTITLVDGFRRKLAPSEWEHEMYVLTTSWEKICSVRQVRVEVFGQATWDHNLRRHFERWNYNGPAIVPCATYNSGGGRGAQKLMRAWSRLEPLFKPGRLRLPNRLMVTDENHRLYDLIAYFLDFEYDLFPLPQTDDILDTLALIAEPEEKVGAIEYPERNVPWQDSRDWDEDRGGSPPPGIYEDGFLWT